MFKCDDAGFIAAVHSLTDFEVYVSFKLDDELVFFHDFIRYEFVVDAEVLVVLHRGAKVEVFDVDAHLAGSFVFIRNGAVNAIYASRIDTAGELGSPG